MTRLNLDIDLVFYTGTRCYAIYSLAYLYQCRIVKRHSLDCRRHVTGHSIPNASIDDSSQVFVFQSSTDPFLVS